MSQTSKRILRFALACALTGCSTNDAPSMSGAAERDAGEPPSAAPAESQLAATSLGRASGPVSGGLNMPFTASPLDLSNYGYTEAEYFLEGDATAYTTQGELGTDGIWSAVPKSRMPYKTRLLVRRPSAGARFNGTVLVEWFNVSGGADADPGFSYVWEELLRGGYAYVGVSAQQIGVEGGGFAIPLPGGSTPLPLKAYDASRYGSLNHPGDDYSYDIFSQAGAAIAHAGDVDLLPGLAVEKLIAYGESQSAMRLVSYVDAIHPLVHVFDGFFIHNRSAGGAPISSAPQDLFGNLASSSATFIRADIDVPVFQFLTETDLFGVLGGFYQARQPDSDQLRTWEVAGTSHADEHVTSFRKGTPGANDFGCGRVNTGPQHFVLKAGVHALQVWMSDGSAPPIGDPLQVDTTRNAIARDDDGNARGGVRTPHVEVPIATLTGEPPSGTRILCQLFGQTIPFTRDKLAELYPTHQSYVDRVTEAARATREAGFLLPQEEAIIVADSMAARIPE